MRKVIAVRGISNSGKTTSIKAALDKLIDRPDAEVKYLRRRNEVIAVVRINGKIIVIASAGDTEEILKDLFCHRIKSIEWDVLVCATKSRGRTVAFIEETIKNNNYDFAWIDKKRAEEEIRQDEENWKTAQEILREIGVD